MCNFAKAENCRNATTKAPVSRCGVSLLPTREIDIKLDPECKLKKRERLNNVNIHERLVFECRLNKNLKISVADFSSDFRSSNQFRVGGRPSCRACRGTVQIANRTIN